MSGRQVAFEKRAKASEVPAAFICERSGPNVLFKRRTRAAGFPLLALDKEQRKRNRQADHESSNSVQAILRGACPAPSVSRLHQMRHAEHRNATQGSVRHMCFVENPTTVVVCFLRRQRADV
jgi:hypothetical protein